MANDDAAVRKVAEIEGGGYGVYVGSPTVFELYVGVALSDKPKVEKSKILSILSSLPQLSLDLQSASEGGLIYGDGTRSGSGLDPIDAMIAGIARTHGEAIVTRNTRHFEGIDGVSVEPY
jgi:predicted nucleic acid-binding protein